jgi:tripartite ATP-independent transporter DctM subunit
MTDQAPEMRDPGPETGDPGPDPTNTALPSNDPVLELAELLDEEAARHIPERAKAMIYLDRVLEVLCVASLFVELIIIFGNIVLRDYFSHPLLWDQEVATLPLMIMTYIAGALAYGRGDILVVDRLLRYLPRFAQRGAGPFGDIGVLLFGAAVIGGSIPYLQSEWSDTSTILGIPTTWYVLPLPIAAVIFIVYALDRLRSQSRKDLLLGVAGAVATAVIILVVQVVGNALDLDPTPVLMIVLFVALLALAVPMAIVFTLVPWIYLALTRQTGLEVIPTNLFTSANNPTYLAVPFFVLAGYLLGRGGLTQGLLGFIDRLIGRFRGGLLQASTVTMYLFSGLSGSKLADVAAVGAALEEEVAEQGYSRERLAAVLSASAIMGETVPPSTSMVVLGAITTLSISALFIAGLFPAATLAVIIMIVTFVLERRSQRDRSQIRGAGGGVKGWLLSGAGAVPSLIVIAIIVASITSGAATPVEASAVAAVVGVVLVAIRARKSFPSVIWDVGVRTAIMVGVIQLVVAAAGMISWALSDVQGDVDIQNFFEGLHSRPLFLLLSVLILPLFGSVLEGLPAIILLGPLLVPVAQAYHINGIQYAIVLILAIGLGTFAPPMGVGYLFACRVVRSDERSTARALMPYLIATWLGIVAIAFIPSITTSLPGWLSLT